MKTRPYNMTARADARASTHQRILQAGVALFWERQALEITLDDIAQRAQVTVQTVLRHFGTREKVLDAVEQALQEEIIAERRAPPGDISAAIQVIFDHYERRGDAVLRLLGQEFWNERIRAGMDGGRQVHREWVSRVFAPQMAALPRTEREELIDLLVVATDVYTWKLLRRDRGLDRTRAQERVARLIASILHASSLMGDRTVGQYNSKKGEDGDE